jgi:putative ABC transport system substrate-binding protein
MRQNRVTRNALGLLPLPLGEGWGEGLWSLDGLRTPSPQPSPRRGEGAERARGASDGMRRRAFISLLAGAAAWPLAARAQQVAVPIVGFLNGSSAWESAHIVGAFRQGLSEVGYVDGRNVAMDYRWAEGHYDRLSALAADLVRRQVAVIACNTPAAIAAKAATTTIPIVFSSGTDPIRLGLVSSLNKPGGNVTGVSFFSVMLEAKRLGLLRELVPTAAAFAVILNPQFPDFEAQANEIQEAGRRLGVPIQILRASSEREIDLAFAKLTELRAGGLLVGADPFLYSQRDYIVGLAARSGVPAIYEQRENAVAGGLASYGTNITDAYRQAGIYTGRILNGEKPGELPVLQPTKFELVINLKAAEALGLAIAPGVLAIADEVIE